MSNKEPTDLSVSRKKSIAPKAGSVWESRMKLDQVKGGIKVFNGEPNDTTQIDEDKKNPVVKRKTWKSEGSPVQIVKQRSNLCKNLDESSRASVSPVPIEKTRSDGIEKTLIGIRKSRSDQEFGVCEEKKIVSHSENVVRIKGEELDKGMEVEVVKQSLDNVKEISKIVIEETKLIKTNENSQAQSSSTVKKQVSSALSHSRIYKNSAKTLPISENFNGNPRSHGKLQSFVDLVMWRDVSKSAFIFGFGTFLIISSSFTKDLKISFISVLSYIGLVYLAAIFLFRSIVNRGSIETDNIDQDYIVGEEEAICVTKFLLPFVNEFLLKLKALFSGDPATTMKLAVFLFILARCGSSVTIWMMAKLGFLGVFTIPKLYSSYSSHFIAYGTFWTRRFGDAWESCYHKKAVGFAIFALVWNLSSIVARIWAVFMLFVAFKYYQQHSSLIKDKGTQEERRDEKLKTQRNLQSQTRATSTEVHKQKKPS